MNKSQDKKLKRLLAINNFLKKNNAITATLINATVWQPRLESISDEIIDHSAQQTTPQTGMAKNKKALKDNLAKSGFYVVTCARAYARSINDMVLYEKVNYTFSSLSTLNDTDLVNASNTIYTAATANIAAISAVTTLVPADLTDYKQLITNFTPFLPQAQSTRSASKLHTEAIMRLFTEVDDTLKEVADYIAITQFTEPAYYQEYLKANIIGNAITRNRALQISVVNKLTQQPILKADISIVGANGTKVVNKKTTAKGNIYLQDLKEQDYTITIVQAGYQKYNATVSVTDGTTFNLIAEMEML